MRLKYSVLGLAVLFSCTAIQAAPAAPPALLSAQAIDLTALKAEDLPQVGQSPLHTLALVATENGTVNVQTGFVPKHMHQHSDEIQLILEGTGTIWVGNERKPFKPGTLLVFPRGVAHGGADAPYKSLAIKLPPAVAGDSQKLD